MSRKVIITIVFLIVLFLAIGAGILLTQNTNGNGQTTTTTSTTSQAATTANGTSQIGISLSTVAQHSTRTDCWLAISGKVYNVTSFVNQHPGGAEILQGCGKDATAMFQAQGHSNQAASMMAQFYIGDLVQ